MLRGQRAVLKISVLAMAAVAASGGFGYAQTTNSARTGSVDLTTRLQYDTNPNLQVSNPSGEFTVSERLNFSILMETRSQQFSATGGADAQYSSSNGVDLTRPDVRLRYSTDRKNSNFNARVGYSEVDVVGSFDIDPSAAVILISDPGTLRTLSGGATVNVGLNAPFTFTGNVDHRDVQVLNTLDPSLFDSSNTVVGGTGQLRFSPVTQGTVSVAHNMYSANDATQTKTDTTTADFSISHEVKSALTLSANVGYLRRDLELNGASNVRSGFKAGLGVNQDRPAGAIFGQFSYDQTGPSDRTSLTLGGSQQMPTGALGASVTAANVQGSGLQLIGNANYTQQLSDGSIRLNLNQAFQTDQNDNETLTTRLGLGFQQNVTATSNLSVDLNYARVEDAGNGSQPTQNRASLAAAYDRALTPDWNMSVGYTHRLFSDPNGTANSDSVFLSLSRNVQFGF